MKVLVQIPCLNEEENIAKVIASIPTSFEGCEQLDILVIDDGSTDKTVEYAQKAGASVIVSKARTRGLADSFKLGQAYFLSGKYDILVNTDGDNQYFQERIPDLIRPIIEGRADVVIGDRSPAKLRHFSLPKRIMQRIGSGIVSYVAGTSIADAASGFRAYSRSTVARLFITTRFSYAMESIIQAGNKGLKVVSIETGAQEVKRPSRLFNSTLEHMRRSGAAILKSLLMYRPLQVFSSLALLLMTLGLFPMIRYLILVLTGVAGQHLQSLILGSLLITAAVVSIVLGLVAELSRIHRELFEEEKAMTRMSEQLDRAAVLAFYSAKVSYSAISTSE